MKKIVLYFITYVFAISCSSPIKLGAKIANFQESDTLLLNPLGALISKKQIVYKNCRYNLGIQNNKVVYVGTSDANFKIVNLKVGITYNDIKHPLDTLIKNGAFGSAHVRIKGNWHAGFKLDSITENSKILFFFKYKFSRSKGISARKFKLSVPKGVKITE